jgi:hypothetical protein
MCVSPIDVSWRCVRLWHPYRITDADIIAWRKLDASDAAPVRPIGFRAITAVTSIESSTCVVPGVAC